MMKEKQYETIRVFFKIKDSEIHGGEDGYAEAEICLRANDLKKFRLQDNIQKRRLPFLLAYAKCQEKTWK